VTERTRPAGVPLKVIFETAQLDPAAIHPINMSQAPRPEFKLRYENFIGGQWTPPASGKYFDNPSPVDGEVFTQIPQSDSADIDLAVEAAWKAAPSWTRTSVAERSAILNKIADRLEANLPMLAAAETRENGKAIRETLNADLPPAIDHFR